MDKLRHSRPTLLSFTSNNFRWFTNSSYLNLLLPPLDDGESSTSSVWKQSPSLFVLRLLLLWFSRVFMCRQWLPLCNDNLGSALTISPISIRRSRFCVPQQWSPILIHVLYLTAGNSTILSQFFFFSTRHNRSRREMTPWNKVRESRTPLVPLDLNLELAHGSLFISHCPHCRPHKSTKTNNIVCLLMRISLFACDEIDPLHN